MIPIVPVNVDRALPAKFFADSKVLYVTSIFRTIQGEGPFAGFPAVFVRLAGCNFGAKTDFCPFCDTSFQIDKAQQLTPEQLMQNVLALPGVQPNRDILVITGGEPMLQPLVLDFLDLLYDTDAFKVYQFETNGTQAAFVEEAVLRESWNRVVLVVSPKPSFRTGKYPELKPVVLFHTDFLKFVVSADPDSPHHEVPQWALELRAKEERNRETATVIFVSPMTLYLRAPESEVSSFWDETLIDRKSAANYEYAAKYSMDTGLILSLQTHLFTAVP